MSGSGSFSGSSCSTVAGSRACSVKFTAGLTQTGDQRLRLSYPGDGDHAAVTGDVTIRLLTAVGDTYTTAVNKPLGIAAPGVLGNDRNAAGGAASLVTGPLHGSLTLRSDGSFSYTPAHNYRGKDAFTYRIKLGSIWSLPAIVTITVG